MVTLEQVLDKIAEEIITSSDTNITPSVVQQNQKTIRDGIVSVGRSNSEKLVLYQKDEKANLEDLNLSSNVDDSGVGMNLKDIVNTLSTLGATIETTQVLITPLESPLFDISLIHPPNTNDYVYNITNLLSEISVDGTILNPLNVSQFMNVEQKRTQIDPDQANEFLDTNIYELLPNESLRQEQINNLFNDIDELLSPNLPDFDQDNDGVVDRISGSNEWVGSEQYYLANSISATQETNSATIDEESSYITRLNSNTNSDNTSKSIEDLRNRLNRYLVDIDEQPPLPQDERQEYKNSSDGYLKFRNLNQGIIVRNTNSEFVKGLNPNTREYLNNGFTITMWVRFLDKTSEGTLFNFGNPLRVENPIGFKLDTFVLSSDSPTGLSSNPTLESVSGYSSVTTDGNPNGVLFQDTDRERFVRLIVYDNNIGKTYDSHTAMKHMSKKNYLPIPGNFSGSDSLSILNNVKIPMDFKEWYFICATFNPNIDEDNSFIFDGPGPAVENPQKMHSFWMNNYNPTEMVSTTNSGFGNKCKVEIISRTDLLRARGYKV